jgi:hypothetical protein
VAKTELTSAQLTPPNPDLEAKAADYFSAHHKALIRLGRRLQWDLMTEAPLTYAWLTYPLELLLHGLAGLGSTWALGAAYSWGLAHWQDFRARRKTQAVAILANAIRHPDTPMSRKHFCAETLGLEIGQPFHLDPQPLQAALTWLDKNVPNS